jgi:sulfotransferase family protein
MLVRRAFRHLSRVSDVLFRTTLLEREVTIFDDDIWLTSYPRSGNTWTRFLVGNLLHDEPITFLNVERLVPDMYKTADWVMRRLPRPRIMKSHECFDPRYRKVIYIVRDPRDVAISNYHFEMKLRSVREGTTLDQFVPRWVDGVYWRRIGSWADHVNSWLSTREGQPGFLLVRYEQLQADPPGELARIAAFVGLETSPERIARAVELSSAQNMRKMERTQGERWVATSHTRADKPFVGKASSGGWRDTLPAASLAHLEAHWGTLMQRLGYELAAHERSVAGVTAQS